MAWKAFLDSINENQGPADVLGELHKLNGFDNVTATLKTLIGKEIK